MMNLNESRLANFLFALLFLILAVKMAEALVWYRHVLNMAFLAGILLVSMGYAFYLYRTTKKNPWDSVALAHLVAFFTVGFLVLFLQYMLQDNLVDRSGIFSLDRSRRIFVIAMIWLMTGIAVARARFNQSNRISFAIIAYSLLLVAVNFNPDVGIINYAAISKTMGVVVSHLSVGEYVLIFTFFSYALAGPKARLAIFPTGCLIQYAQGGRASLILGMVAIILYELLNLWLHNRNFWRYLVAGVSLLVAGVGLLVYFVNTSEWFFSPMLFSGSITNDNSYLARLDMFNQGLRNLPSQFWFGDPGWLVTAFNYTGSYIHNGLSAWQFFGFPFFLILVSAIIVSLRRMMATMKYSRQSRFDDFRAIMLLYAVLSIIFAKAVVFFGIWFAVGLWLGVGIPREVQKTNQQNRAVE